MPRQTRGKPVEVMVVPEEEEEITGTAIGAGDGEPEVVFFSLRRFALPPLRIRHRLTAVERLLKREEADVVLVAGNVALVAFEIVEWPVAALTLAVHALARTRWKTLQALAEVAEEVE
jgi:hypothetical protein